MKNRIAIITLDGGAGKTAVAFALAKDLDYYLISNDDSVIERAYEGRAKIMKQPKVID
jgi:shikimate kinase